jgi:hypothetical protein
MGIKVGTLCWVVWTGNAKQALPKRNQVCTVIKPLRRRKAITDGSLRSCYVVTFRDDDIQWQALPSQLRPINDPNLDVGTDERIVQPKRKELETA